MFLLSRCIVFQTIHIYLLIVKQKTDLNGLKLDTQVFLVEH